jgi:hypothetical protein
LLENQESISVVSEKYGVNPNDIYRWKKQLYAGMGCGNDLTESNRAISVSKTKINFRQWFAVYIKRFYGLSKIHRIAACKDINSTSAVKR